MVFEPFGKTTVVRAGSTLLDAAHKARISLESPCGGDGICGRCRVIVKQGRVSGGVTGLLSRDEIRQGYVLACQTRVQGDLIVEIPERSRARERITIDLDAQRFKAELSGVHAREFSRAPLVTKVFLALAEPTLEDNVPDCQRVLAGIEKQTGIASIQAGLKTIQRMPTLLREGGFKVTATVGRRRGVSELMDMHVGDTSQRNFVTVVDMGTTTIVAHLVNAVTGETVDTQACFNSQSVCGREVTARMIAAERSGADRLQDLLVDDINRMVETLSKENGVALGDITAVVCAGNTAMTHFLLGLPTHNIRRSPFIAVTGEPPPFRAAEVGIKIASRGLLFTVPGIGGWVGGDVTAGLLATGVSESEDTCMFIDIGTNGEIVLGNKEWLIACSASVGPALEGASVECGMMAETGAIEKVFLEDGEARFDVIGGGEPNGICGSGIIDLVAVLLEKGVLDRSGKLVEGTDPALRFEEGLGRYTLASATESRHGEEVYISQQDIDNIVTAKAAVFAASKIMLDRLGLGLSDIKMLYIAGGFGSHIDLAHAVAIGLLPDLPLENIQYVGNTSVWGAKIAALSADAYGLLHEIVRRTTYYDLMGTNDYVEQFQQAMFLPHTNIELFPSQLSRENA